ncbi:unnamed protein product [Arabidopsis lyrata]|uniref:Predicted protein n=1 Tax=Arabidopsis lyrata subsp. lyrata TaxID=81972 RepID=D7LKM3_ARALL|nr:predicted protein [Arabidopsis lyrata subsp. lyrata]CAH8263513.1 unnamed protein product [Arabidopsis lyrata]
MDKIIALQKVKSSLEAAARGRKLLKTSIVVNNAKEHVPKANHVARETAAATQAARERKVDDQLNQILDNRRPGN